MSDNREHERLMLHSAYRKIGRLIGRLSPTVHFGEHGPTEPEVWNERTESATTITATWATDPKESKDITRQLHRAGYKLVPIDDD